MEKFTLRVFFLSLFVIGGSPCAFSQQQILLIGTKHQTPETEIVQMLPVKEAVLEFKPDIICTEYLKPTDVESLKYVYGARHFSKQDSLRKAWNLPSAGDKKKMEALMIKLKEKSDPFLRMELRNLFYVRSDFANSDYHAFRVMAWMEADSSKIGALRKRFPMFNEMKARYLRQAQNHDEYNFLVFPIVKQLSLVYLNPVDDKSSAREYNKNYRAINDMDTLFENRKNYYDRTDAFRNRMNLLPPETNTWVYSNSPEILNDLMYLEGYKTDVGNSSQEIKMLNYYSTIHHKKIAINIDQLAKRNPGKKIAVFLGLSHIGPVQEELKKLSKKYSVITLYDLIN